MIALRLVRLIETHSEELAEGLTHNLLSSERTRDLRKVPANELHRRCHEIYRNLSDWLLSKTDHDIETVYKDLGARRASQGVSLAALAWALMLTKEQLWSFLEREGVHGAPHNVFGELELLRLLDQFFDRAIYHATEGYEQAVAQKIA
jgi:RsbT co-antagonist protein rsbRD N-terminal domain